MDSNGIPHTCPVTGIHVRWWSRPGDVQQRDLFRQHTIICGDVDGERLVHRDVHDGGAGVCHSH